MKAKCINTLLPGNQGLLLQMTLDNECGEGERDDDGHFFLASVDFIHPENGDWARVRSIPSGHRDYDATVLELRRSFREHGVVQGVKDRPQITGNLSKGPCFSFLLSDARSASASNADQFIVVFG